jgi:hypothetical protein
VTRWRRYGKDRLYVREDDGSDIGWWDLEADESHPASPELAEVLLEVVSDWRSHSGYAGAAHVPVPVDGMLASETEALEAAGTAEIEVAPRTVAPVHESPLPVSPVTPELPPMLGWVEGVAGGSAAHEFQRRHDARRERVTTAHPRIGRFLLAVFDDPQSTRAWSVGADGENALGGMLQRMAGPALRVLHDRRIPRTTANIDHLAICSSGVWVVDAKRYVNSRPELRVEGGIIRPRTELLLVGGRDRTKLVEGMHKQLTLVRTALADQPDVPVRGVLCFVDGDWPVIGGDFTVRDVAVVWPKKLAKLLVQPGPLDPDRIAELQWQLHEAFPRAKT